MAKLTSGVAERSRKLSNRISSPFILSFKYRLENGYAFSDLNTQHLKEFQSFLNLASKMTFEQGERRYRRKPDTTDSFDGAQVIHYGISQSFRIHGIVENGQFMVLRLDPSHRFHR